MKSQCEKVKLGESCAISQKPSMLWVRHNKRINMKPINQHIPIMMTLTFIHVRSTQCACVRNIDVMITNQRYGPDVSKYQLCHTLTASLCNRKNDSWRNLTLFRTDPLCNSRSDRPWGGIRGRVSVTMGQEIPYY